MIENISRRSAISSMGGGFGAAALGSLLSDTSKASEEGLHHRPKVKRVIQLFMNGGAFQGDFFDPKPSLNKFAGQRPDEVTLRTERKTGGLLECPFKYSKYGESGLEVSELLPRLAVHADDLCVLRSVYTDNPNHGPALLLMNNGSITPTVPSLGSWMLYGLGTENENLPGYVVLCPGRPVRFSILWSSAFLPSEFQGSYVNHSKIEPEKMIPFLRGQRQTLAAQREDLDLLAELNRQHLKERIKDSRLEGRIKNLETAFRMQTEGSEAFDLTREDEATREAYGDGHFANGCLLARRLVERGVRFVQVYYGNGQPWDTHSNHNTAVKPLAKSIDQPMAALFADLKRRGMFEDTLILWGGEFGRTPVSENGNGRDHNHYGLTMMLAGGGVQGGMAYGATDDFGFRAVENRMHVNDIHATVLHLLGIDHERLTYRYAGRDFRLTDVGGNVANEILT
ncbi:MAG: sulfatase [Planctomycetaceae bacterium]|nr:sulfatase [Planctomycetaceae bacterium]